MQREKRKRIFMEVLEPFCWGAISQYATRDPEFRFPRTLAG